MPAIHPCPLPACPVWRFRGVSFGDLTVPGLPFTPAFQPVRWTVYNTPTLLTQGFLEARTTIPQTEKVDVGHWHQRRRQDALASSRDRRRPTDGTPHSLSPARRQIPTLSLPLPSEWSLTAHLLFSVAAACKQAMHVLRLDAREGSEGASEGRGRQAMSWTIYMRLHCISLEQAAAPRACMACSSRLFFSVWGLSDRLGIHRP
jgi:hypothetical protein